MGEKKNSLLKALANAVSMVTIPAGVLAIPTNPFDVGAWVLLICGIAIQFIKYYAEYELEYE